MHVWRTLEIDMQASAPIITRALRSWRKACDRGLETQPQLAGALEDEDSMMLAPVFDSLFRFYEAALARPVEVGGAAGASADESQLIRLVGRPGLCASALDCPAGVAGGLHCALCSTRIMLLAAPQPPGSRPQ